MAQRIKDYSLLSMKGDIGLFFETRLENDASGNPLYVGYTNKVRAATSDSVWFIVKMGYDGNGFLDRKQLPDNGTKFTYSWDDRATYFS